MNFNKKDYKNATLAEILETLHAAVPEFDARKRGPAFRAILFTLADVFQEDRPTMYQQFGGVTPKRPQPPTGGAKITRHRDQVKGKYNAAKARSGKPCDSCPDTKGIIAGKEQVLETASVKKKAAPAPAAKFESVEDLRSKFEDNVTAMRAYAQSQDIKINAAVTKPETMARIIFEKMNEQTQDEE